MKNILYIPILILFLFSSCKNKIEDVRIGLIKEALGASNLTSKKTKTMLIIPNSGCDGCITKAEKFIKDHSSKLPSTIFIFTGISSFKILKYKMGEDILRLPNVHLDTLNRFYTGNLMSIYPLVVYFQNGLPSKIIEQSPYNPNTLDSLYTISLPLANIPLSNDSPR